MFGDFLNILAASVVLVFAIVAVIDFTIGLVHLWKSVAPNLQIEKQPIADSLMVENCADVPKTKKCLDTWVKQDQLICSTPLVLEVVDRPDLAHLTAVQLRRLCAAQGVKWRNVSQGKHLTKSEMIERLAAL